ncbi:hypothetical protein [Pseudaquabacterium pictum]|uniref:Uncharacterized protein n=1 Tax=Pseudaquabacterium pictum TaxID=2315236 RepID=A0A480AM39_9BURK|nr:hypothetical protein [Rubrivivax pictus]GCL61457.1 hypothetical protein AQPW35_05380 [Rubrivivax pictus]
MSRSFRLLLVACAALPGLLHPAAVLAQGVSVYRCPGPPVLYTDALTAEEARDRGCRTIEGAPITIVQTPRPRPPANATSAPAPATSAARPGDPKVDPAAQRQRDTDARRILEAELKREEERLAVLKREYNNGEPERRGDERNYQNYLDRVAQMKAGILRSESDVAALKRELSKLPP